MDGCGAGGEPGAQELGVRGGWKHCEGRGLRGWRGRHQMQQEGAAAAGQALQGREGPSAIGGMGGSKKCGRDTSTRYTQQENIIKRIITENNKLLYPGY